MTLLVRALVLLLAMLSLRASGFAVRRGLFAAAASRGGRLLASSAPTSLPPRTVVCKSEEEIEALGARLSEVAGVGDVLLLRGDLGAGKTTLARGLIRHKFCDETLRVTSPSYLLDNSYEYGEDQVIHHMDLYRLPTGCDLSMLGMPAIFSTCLCIIEWPQRMGPGQMPAEFLDVDMTIGPDGQERRIMLTPSSQRWSAALAEVLPTIET